MIRCIILVCIVAVVLFGSLPLTIPIFRPMKMYSKLATIEAALSSEWRYLILIWYKINQRWWIDMTQVRAFGKPKESPNTIIIQWKDGKEDNFGVDNADKELIKLEEFV